MVKLKPSTFKSSDKEVKQEKVQNKLAVFSIHIHGAEKKNSKILAIWCICFLQPGVARTKGNMSQS